MSTMHAMVDEAACHRALEECMDGSVSSLEEALLMLAQQQEQQTTATPSGGGGASSRIMGRPFALKIQQGLREAADTVAQACSASRHWVQDAWLPVQHWRHSGAVVSVGSDDAAKCLAQLVYQWQWVHVSCQTLLAPLRTLHGPLMQFQDAIEHASSSAMVLVASPSPQDHIGMLLSCCELIRSLAVDSLIRWCNVHHHGWFLFRKQRSSRHPDANRNDEEVSSMSAMFMEMLRVVFHEASNAVWWFRTATMSLDMIPNSTTAPLHLEAKVLCETLMRELEYLEPVGLRSHVIVATVCEVMDMDGDGKVSAVDVALVTKGVSLHQWIEAAFHRQRSLEKVRNDESDMNEFSEEDAVTANRGGVGHTVTCRNCASLEAELLISRRDVQRLTEQLRMLQRLNHQQQQRLPRSAAPTIASACRVAASTGLPASSSKGAARITTTNRPSVNVNAPYHCPPHPHHPHHPDPLHPTRTSCNLDGSNLSSSLLKDAAAGAGDALYQAYDREYYPDTSPRRRPSPRRESQRLRSLMAAHLGDPSRDTYCHLSPEKETIARSSGWVSVPTQTLQEGGRRGKETYGGRWYASMYDDDD